MESFWKIWVCRRKPQAKRSEGYKNHSHRLDSDAGLERCTASASLLALARLTSYAKHEAPARLALTETVPVDFCCSSFAFASSCSCCDFFVIRPLRWNECCHRAAMRASILMRYDCPILANTEFNICDIATEHRRPPGLAGGSLAWWARGIPIK